MNIRYVVLLLFYAFTICAMDNFDRRFKDTSSEQFDLAQQVKKHQAEIELGKQVCLVITQELNKVSNIHPVLLNIIAKEEIRDFNINTLQDDYNVLLIRFNAIEKKDR